MRENARHASQPVIREQNLREIWHARSSLSNRRPVRILFLCISDVAAYGVLQNRWGHGKHRERRHKSPGRQDSTTDYAADLSSDHSTPSTQSPRHRHQTCAGMLKMLLLLCLMFSIYDWPVPATADSICWISLKKFVLNYIWILWSCFRLKKKANAVYRKTNLKLIEVCMMPIYLHKYCKHFVHCIF